MHHGRSLILSLIRCEATAFLATLALMLATLHGRALIGDKVLSPSDVLKVQQSFGAPVSGPVAEPSNRLLMDPALQFEPWIEFNRAMIRRGVLPVWNPYSGCGAPHLANSQSGVFDPFHVIAYAGSLPVAYAWMAFARLMVAGFGAWLLARSWELGRVGRWTLGLTYPFCGYMTVWLLYPVASCAVWFPWLLWCVERLLARPDAAATRRLAIVTCLAFLGGHVQTTAHMLMGTALYAMARGVSIGIVARSAERMSAAPIRWRSAVVAMFAAAALGIGSAAPQWLPLAAYLKASPVWADREAETPPAWQIRAPRVGEMVTTLAPYVWGSQRAGHPNLAGFLGLDNLNESAGGFVGLPAILTLVPIGLLTTRRPIAVPLACIGLLGLLGAAWLPPVDNLLRGLPYLQAIDHRRLTIWVAMAVAGLAALGADWLARTGQVPAARKLVLLTSFVAVAFLAAGTGIWFVSRAWLESASTGSAGWLRSIPLPDLDPARIHREVEQVVAFLPSYLAFHGLLAGGVAVVVAAAGRRQLAGPVAAAAILLLNQVDLLSFSAGANPLLSHESLPVPAPGLIEVARRCPPPARVIGVGDELLPNAAMRMGLADVRNYDSIELLSTLEWLEPVFEPEDRPMRSSRRLVTWRGVKRAQDRLIAANVQAVISDHAPPPGWFANVEQMGDLWVAWLPSSETRSAYTIMSYEPGRIELELSSGTVGRLRFPEASAPGWRAAIDGTSADFLANEPFLAVDVPTGARRLSLAYDPPEVRAALVIGGLSLLITALLPRVLAWLSRKNEGPDAWMASEDRVRIGLIPFQGPTPARLP